MSEKKIILDGTPVDISRLTEAQNDPNVRVSLIKEDDEQIVYKTLTKLNG